MIRERMAPEGLFGKSKLCCLVLRENISILKAISYMKEIEHRSFSRPNV